MLETQRGIMVLNLFLQKPLVQLEEPMTHVPKSQSNSKMGERNVAGGIE